MKTFDSRIAEVVTLLRIKEKVDKKGNSYYSTTKGKMYTLHEVKSEIRKILGVDNQCFQCSDWHFDHDLTLVQGTHLLICSDCSEKIISGEIKLNEYE